MATYLSFLPIGLPAQSRLVFRPIYPQVVTPTEEARPGQGSGWGIPWEFWGPYAIARKRKKKDEDALREALQEAYADVAEEAGSELREIAEPFLKSGALPASADQAPSVRRVDFRRMARDLDAVRDLIELHRRLREVEDDDEDAAELLLMH